MAALPESLSFIMYGTEDGKRENSDNYDECHTSGRFNLQDELRNAGPGATPKLILKTKIAEMRLEEFDLNAKIERLWALPDESESEKMDLRDIELTRLQRSLRHKQAEQREIEGFITEERRRRKANDETSTTINETHDTSTPHKASLAKDQAPISL
jgi:hypothetical protein